MDFVKLKKEVQDISDLASQVPEAFREKCFEILLQQLLAEDAPSGRGAQESKTTEMQPPPEKSTLERRGSGQLPIKAQLRVFMKRTGVSNEDLEKVVLFEDGDVHFIREPGHGNVAKGQMEWALLLALKSAVLNNEFSADPEDLRSVCQAKGFYDRANFAAIFKRDPYAGYFRQPLQAQGPRQPLSADGQSALGDLVKSLSGQPE